MAGIYKAYDIRGIYSSEDQPGQLSPATAYRIGMALGAPGIWPAGDVLVSHDMRPSSPVIVAALTAGLQASGRQVRQGGMMTTPMHYWYNRRWQVAGSVQVTASHNPAAYNGLKVSGAEAAPMGYDNALREIERRVAASATPIPACPAPEGVDSARLLADYAEFLSEIDVRQSWRLCIDAGSGMAGYDLPAILSEFPRIQWQGLCMEPDGNFPYHEANPLDYETLHMLQAELRHGRYDLGVAFDGDADRAMFLTGRGTIIKPDALTAFLAESFLLRAQQRGEDMTRQAVVYDVRMSDSVARCIEATGARAIRGKVGHAFMKQLLKDHGAVFGGEVSCHFYFGDLGNTDSAIYAMLMGLHFFEQRSVRPEELNDLYAPYPKSEEINFKVADAQAAMQAVAQHYLRSVPGARMDELDGVTVWLTDRWFNLRASNTEPLLRLNAEITDRNATQRDLDAFVAEISDQIISGYRTGHG